MTPDLPPISETLVVHEKTIAARRKIYWPRTNLGRQAEIRSVAFVCPVCGELWARRVSSNPDNNLSSHAWVCEMRACEKCAAPGDETAGSLVLSESEWDSLLEHSDDPATQQAIQTHYPIEWLAYELFLKVRKETK